MNRASPCLILPALVAVAVTLPAPAQAQACVAAPPQLLSWYSADDHVDDGVGFHHGRRVGAGFAPGAVGAALSFDGIDQSVRTDITLDEMRSVAADFSVALWARPRAARQTLAETEVGTSATVGQRFALFPTSGGADGAGLGLSIGSNGVTVVQHGDGLFAPVLVHDAALDRWVHLALVVEAGVPTLFVDGVAARTGLAGTRELVFASWRDLGTDASDALHVAYGAYAGELDELMVFDRALADAEVATLAGAAEGVCRPACNIAFPGANDDPWDVTRGNEVTADSGMRDAPPGSGQVVSFARDAFGALETFDDPGVASFRAGMAVGNWYSIDWRSTGSMQAQRFQLQAAHSIAAGLPGAVDRLRILGRATGAPEYTVLLEREVAVPFPIVTVGNARLELCLALRPQSAQEFRLELRAATDVPGALAGPELFELNGYGPVAPDVFRDGFEPVPGPGPD